MKKRQDPDLVSQRDAKVLYEVGLIEQHGMTKEEASKLCKLRSDEGYFPIPDQAGKMANCPLFEWVPMSKEEKKIAFYVKKPVMVDVQSDPAHLTPAQRRDLYVSKLKDAEALLEAEADVVGEELWSLSLIHI